MKRLKENILIVEQFIEGLKNKDTDQLPLHDNVLLISPLQSKKRIEGSLKQLKNMLLKARAYARYGSCMFKI